MTRVGPYLLGIDAGTQSTKACVFSPRGRRVAMGTARLAVSSPQPSWAEQDPRAWARSMRAALRAAQADVDASRVEAVGLAFQRETFALLDARGRPVRPALLWLDTRAADEVPRLGETLGRDAYHEATGQPLDVTSAVARMRWLAREERAALRRAVRWTDVGAALAEALTGRAVTCAAGAETCGLVDLERGSWRAAHLEAGGLAPGMMPELARPGEVLGTVTPQAARATGLPKGTPVVAAGGDGHVFAVGMGSTRTGTRTLTLGTSIVLGRVAREPVRADLFRTLRGAGGGYLLECVLQSGTYLIRWFTERFGGDPATWDRRAERIPAGAEGLLTLPHWWGVRFPEARPGARGATLGWANRHTAAHLYRSLVEGLALEVRRMDAAMRGRLGGRAAQTVHVGGGGAAGRLLPPMLADVLAAPVALPREPESTALGAAILAGVGAGRFGSAADGCRAMVKPGRTLKPCLAATQTYERLYAEGYLPAMKAVVALTERLG